MLKAHRLAAFVVLLVGGAVAPAAHAVPVTYSTAGVFGSSMSNTLTQNGVTIRFDSIATTVDVPPTTTAIFGEFVTIGAPPSNAPGMLSDTFRLTITQTAPAPGGVLTYNSTVGGTIFLNNSQAFIQFDPATLSQSITNNAFVTTYRIVEGDDTSPGRLELFGGLNQRSTLNGEISLRAVPEPGTMALACVALPLLGLGFVRRRKTAKV